MKNDKKGQDPDIWGRNIFQCFTDWNGTKGNEILTFFEFKNKCYHCLECEN